MKNKITIICFSILISVSLATSKISQADIRTDVLAKISEEAEGDLILQEIAVEIARAESGFDPSAKNPKSSASGVFQFIKSTWRKNCEGDVFDYNANIACGVRILRQGGFYHWNASNYLWWKKLSPDAKLRVKTGVAESFAEPLKRIVSFLSGKIKIDHKGNILDEEDNIFFGGEIPFI